MFKFTIAVTSVIIIISTAGCSNRRNERNIVYKIGDHSITLRKDCISKITSTQSKINNGVIIALNNDSSCGKKLKDTTRNNIGKELLSYFDGKMITHPTIIHSELDTNHYFQSIDNKKTVSKIIKAYTK